jgi:hypothetical protein
VVAVSTNKPRYPKRNIQWGDDPETCYTGFADKREDFLIDFRYNTARAYWADLDDWLRWAIEHQLDPLCITRGNLHKYLKDIEQVGYANTTLRRRRSTLLRFQKHTSPQPIISTEADFSATTERSNSKAHEHVQAGAQSSSRQPVRVQSAEMRRPRRWVKESSGW